MTPLEAGAILTAASQADNRTWDETTATAWSAMIDPAVTLADAAEAVTAHYTKTRQWLMPADINDYVRQVHRRRMQDAGPPDYPSDLTQMQERAYRELWLGHVKRGESAANATALTDEALNFSRGQMIEAPADVRKAIDGFTAKRTIR